MRANLDDEQKFEADDDCRNSVTHGSEEEPRPKREQRKTREEDDESED